MKRYVYIDETYDDGISIFMRVELLESAAEEADDPYSCDLEGVFELQVPITRQFSIGTYGDDWCEDECCEILLGEGGILTSVHEQLGDNTPISQIHILDFTHGDFDKNDPNNYYFACKTDLQAGSTSWIVTRKDLWNTQSCVSDRSEADNLMQTYDLYRLMESYYEGSRDFSSQEVQAKKADLLQAGFTYNQSLERHL